MAVPLLYRAEHGAMRSSHASTRLEVGRLSGMMRTWRRNRVIDLDRLCWRLGTASLEEVRKNLGGSLAERIARDEIKREPCWTESLAVGSVSFLERIQPQICSRRETEILQTTGELWALQESPIAYGRENGPEKRAIGSKRRDFLHNQVCPNKMLWRYRNPCISSREPNYQGDNSYDTDMARPFRISH